MEDDVRFHKDWDRIWADAVSYIPADADVIYLGGILPPNKQAFNSACELVNPYFARIKPNEVFSPGNPRRYFHSCNYAYVLLAKGAKKIQSIIQEKGIFTSGDHMIVNHMDMLNIYFLHPLVAGCFQDADPTYQQSQFNNFDRVDMFDSDLWNNNEHFSPEEVATTQPTVTVEPISMAVLQDQYTKNIPSPLVSLKVTDSGDIMMEDINLEANALLLKLTQNKLDDVIEMSISFFERHLQMEKVEEKDYNWARVIQQILISQRTRMTEEQRFKVVSTLANLKNTNMANPILKAVIDELIEKTGDKMFGGPPGVFMYPRPNAVKRSHPVWYFVPNQHNVFLEREWIEELISRPLDFMAHGEKESPTADPIQFVLIQKCDPVKEMVVERLNEIAATKKTAVLIHLSDERCDDSLELYDHPAVKLILRNYIREDIKTTKPVITIPLGYVSGRSAHGVFKKTSERKYIWSFAGSVDKPGRLDLLHELNSLTPNAIKVLPTWEHPKPEEAKEYMDMMLESRFIPCPKGQNYETFRLYEALEAGAIPVCVADSGNEHECYNTLVGGSSILTTPNWASVKAMLEQNLSNEVLDQLQDNLTKYWMQHKLNITSKILSGLQTIHNTFIAVPEEPLTIRL